MSGHPGFKAILDERWELHQQKALAYGSAEDPLANLRSGARFGVPIWKRCVIEANDAFTRMENVCNGRNSDNDSIDNALNDASSWCDLALLFLREEREQRNTEVADAQFEFEKKQKLDPDELMARAGFYKWSNGRYRLYPEVVAGSYESVANESVAEDPEENSHIDTGLFRVKVDPVATGYRQPSEEIGNKMNEVLEKAK